MQLLSCLELLQLVRQLILYFIEGIHLCLELLLEFNSSSFTYLDLSFKLIYLGKLLQAYPFVSISKVFKLDSLLFHFFLSLAQLIFKLQSSHLQGMFLFFELIYPGKHIFLLLDILLHCIFDLSLFVLRFWIFPRAFQVNWLFGGRVFYSWAFFSPAVSLFL